MKNRDFKADLEAGLDIHGPLDIARKYGGPAIVLEQGTSGAHVRVHFEDGGEWKEHVLHAPPEIDITRDRSHRFDLLGAAVQWARKNLGFTGRFKSTAYRLAYLPESSYVPLMADLEAWRAELPEVQLRSQQRKANAELRQQRVKYARTLPPRLQRLGITNVAIKEAGDMSVSLALEDLARLLDLAEAAQEPHFADERAAEHGPA